MPRTFDIKTRKENVQSGTSSPCGICHRQFAKYTCPRCNLQYCSLICYRSEPHAGCTETFYKTSLAEQIQAEPTRTREEKQQMLELLKRFEEEAIEDGSEDEDTDEVVSRLQDIDLESADHDALWGLLSEDERQKFLKLIEDPTSEDLKRLLDAQELAEGQQVPWWASEAGSDEGAPAIRPVPENLLVSTQPNPMLLFNVLHTSLSYAYTVRTFAISALVPAGQRISTSQEQLVALRDVLLPLSPFLGDRKSTTIFTSVDSVITDWVSRLSEPPSSALLQLLLSDCRTLFQARAVTETTGSLQSWSHESCMRFLSDTISLVDGSKKHAHIVHKTMFYLALVARLPNQASKDLIDAIRRWETRTQSNIDDTTSTLAFQSDVRRGKLVEQID